MLSIIIPTFNEMANQYLEKSIPILMCCKNIEIIIVDSYSTDGTYEFLKQFDLKIIQVKTTSRAIRLNTGIKEASAKMVVLHHPRSYLSTDAIDFLNTYQDRYEWGAFTHKFDTAHPLLRFTSFWSNFGRARRGIFYLDHCIFAKKDLLIKMNYIPEVDIFEDTALSLGLRKQAKHQLLPFESTTSAIRFQKNGMWKQSYLNQKLKWKYYFNIDHKKMNKTYESGLTLNTDYKDESE